MNDATDGKESSAKKSLETYAKAQDAREGLDSQSKPEHASDISSDRYISTAGNAAKGEVLDSRESHKQPAFTKSTVNSKRIAFSMGISKPKSRVGLQLSGTVSKKAETVSVPAAAFRVCLISIPVYECSLLIIPFPGRLRFG